MISDAVLSIARDDQRSYPLYEQPLQMSSRIHAPKNAMLSCRVQTPANAGIRAHRGYQMLEPRYLDLRGSSWIAARLTTRGHD